MHQTSIVTQSLDISIGQTNLSGVFVSGEGGEITPVEEFKSDNNIQQRPADSNEEDQEEEEEEDEEESSEEEDSEEEEESKNQINEGDFEYLDKGAFIDLAQINIQIFDVIKPSQTKLLNNVQTTFTHILYIQI